ncbi:hypothetical protein FNF31_03308 [Cafeteria roenbergensis]|uniref:cDENN domain-containing protein n=1 Tax=Cafeteria roenbergensis TaxID=33653 RepID=A0A5A8DA59_CAFRO|nr:hypothetical protein FNF31_03308 [Cafeteria roenbergensis]
MRPADVDLALDMQDGTVFYCTALVSWERVHPAVVVSLFATADATGSSATESSDDPGGEVDGESAGSVGDYDEDDVDASSDGAAHDIGDDGGYVDEDAVGFADSGKASVGAPAATPSHIVLPPWLSPDGSGAPGFAGAIGTAGLGPGAAAAAAAQARQHTAAPTEAPDAQGSPSVFAPRALIAVSRLPLFGFQRAVLCQLRRIDAAERRGAHHGQPLAAYMAYVAAAPLPQPGIASLGLPLGDAHIVIARPPPQHLSRLDLPVAPALLGLRPEALAEAVFALICERQVVVVATGRPHLLTPACELLLSLSPLSWVSPYVPVLPPEMAFVLGIPTPCLLGWSGPVSLAVRNASDALIVDLSTGCAFDASRGASAQTPFAAAFAAAAGSSSGGGGALAPGGGAAGDGKGAAGGQGAAAHGGAGAASHFVPRGATTTPTLPSSVLRSLANVLSLASRRAVWSCAAKLKVAVAGSAPTYAGEDGAFASRRSPANKSRASEAAVASAADASAGAASHNADLPANAQLRAAALAVAFASDGAAPLEAAQHGAHRHRSKREALARSSHAFSAAAEAAPATTPAPPLPSSASSSRRQSRSKRRVGLPSAAAAILGADGGDAPPGSGTSPTFTGRALADSLELAFPETAGLVPPLLPPALDAVAFREADQARKRAQAQRARADGAGTARSSVALVSAPWGASDGRGLTTVLPSAVAALLFSQHAAASTRRGSDAGGDTIGGLESGSHAWQPEARASGLPSASGQHATWAWDPRTTVPALALAELDPATGRWTLPGSPSQAGGSSWMLDLPADRLPDDRLLAAVESALREAAAEAARLAAEAARAQAPPWTDAGSSSLSSRAGGAAGEQTASPGAGGERLSLRGAHAAQGDGPRDRIQVAPGAVGALQGVAIASGWVSLMAAAAGFGAGSKARLFGPGLLRTQSDAAHMRSPGSGAASASRPGSKHVVAAASSERVIASAFAGTASVADTSTVLPGSDAASRADEHTEIGGG